MGWKESSGVEEPRAHTCMVANHTCKCEYKHMHGSSWVQVCLQVWIEMIFMGGAAVSSVSAAHKLRSAHVQAAVS